METAVDSCGERSLISDHLLNSIPHDLKILEMPIAIKGFNPSASGSLVVHTAATFNFTVCSQEFTIQALVVPIKAMRYDVLIGWPDCRKMRWILSAEDNSVILPDGTRVPSIGETTALVERNVSIAGLSSMYVPVTTAEKLSQEMHQVHFTPYNPGGHVNSSQRNPLFAEQDIVEFDFDESSQQHVAGVRVFNTSAKPILLRANTALGSFTKLKTQIPEENRPPLEFYHQNADSSPQLSFKIAEQLSEPQKKRMNNFLQGYIQPHDGIGSLFVNEITAGAKVTVEEHEIVLEPGKTFKSVWRRLSPHKREKAYEQIQYMLKKGIIVESSSKTTSPILLVDKQDGSVRFCVDYSELNSITVPDQFEIPLVVDLVAALAGTKYISTLDLASGYWQLGLNQKSRGLAAFNSPFGVYEWTCMPFGLRNAPASFQRVMNKILQEYIGKFCQVYFDDIVIYSRNYEDHLHHLEIVLNKLRDSKIEIKASKCRFAQSEVRYLGKIVNGEGIKPDPEKIAPILNCSVPTTLKQLRIFIGKVTYYREHIKDFAEIMSPLYSLTKESAGGKLRWTEQAQIAFDRVLKVLSSEETFLEHINPRLNETRILYCDASIDAASAILSKVPQGQMFNIKTHYKPVAYFSKVFSSSERKYSTTMRECLAIVWGIERFANELEGVEFVVVTDHAALKWLLPPSAKTPPHIVRWAVRLMPFSFKIIHKPGKEHGNADALSREPFVKPAFGNLTLESEEQNKISVNNFVTETLRAARLPSREVLISSQKEDLLCKYVTASPEELATLKLPIHLKRAAMAYRKQLVIDDSIIKVRDVDNSDNQKEPRILLPESLRLTVIEHYHANVLVGGHLGVTKTVDRVKLGFVWPGIYKDVDKFVTKCHQCLQVKANLGPRLGKLKSIVSSSPFDTVGVDIAGPYPPSNAGFTHILIIVDYFTKYWELVPLKDTTSPIILSAILTHLICRHGVPRKIITDQGSNLISMTAQALYDFFGIDKRRAVAHHQQTDGVAESGVGTLKEMLSAYIAIKPETWSNFLPLLAFAYNTAANATTGYSPFSLVYGREPTLFDKLVYDTRNIDVNQGSALEFKQLVNAYYLQLLNETTDAQFIARANTQAHQEIAAAHYNKKRRDITFKEGDFVYFASRSIKNFETRRKGPYKIIKARSSLVYDLVHPLHPNKPYTTNIVNLIPGEKPAESFDWTKVPPLPEYMVGKAVAAPLTSGSYELTQYWVSFKKDLGALHTEMFLTVDPSEITNPMQIRDRVKGHFRSPMLIMPMEVRSTFLEPLDWPDVKLAPVAWDWYSNFDVKFGAFKALV